jgi:hypothetical protein
MKIKLILLLLVPGFILFSCMGNKENTISERSDTVKTAAGDSPADPSDPASIQKDKFRKTYDDIISAIKKEEYNRVDQYLDSSRGYFLITKMDGQSFYSYQHGEHFEDLSGGEGPEAELSTEFLKKIKDESPELLTLIDQGNEKPDSAGTQAAGTYKISIRKIKPVFSRDYQLNKMGGTEIDKELLQGLTEMEGGFTSKVFFNRPVNGIAKGATLYFSESGDRIYLYALDLTNFK